MKPNRRMFMFAAALAVQAFEVTSAGAGVIFDLVIDPPTTAFNGIPPASGSSGTSTRSGAGTFHIYALDDTPGSLGIANYSVGLLGSITVINHRAPLTNVQDANGDVFAAGFHLGRTGTNVNPIQGSQAPTDLSPFQIYGFGKELSNLSAEITAPNMVAGPTINGQWGNYATDPSETGFNGGRWLFIGEGTYTGARPSFNPDLTTAQIFTGVNQYANTDVCVETLCPFPPIGLPVVLPEPPYFDPFVTQGEIVTTQFAANDFAYPSGPFTFSNAQLASFVPYSPGAVNPAFNGTVDSAGNFTWDTTGFAHGVYIINVVATNPSFISSVPGGQFVVTLFIPEPSAAALVFLAACGVTAAVRRRRM
jgi:hypothetical protein